MIHGRRQGRRARLWILAAALAAVWVALAAPLRAQGTGAETAASTAADLEAGLRAAEAELLAGFEALVAFCTQQRLFASREALCHEILALDPSSEVAHEGLLHKRDRDGNWEPPKKRSPVKDYKRSKVKEFQVLRAEVCEAYAAGVLNLTTPLAGGPSGAAPARPGPARPDPERRAREAAALARALELSPDHVDLRARLGEQRSGDGWVLDETVRAKARRGELKAIVLAAYAAVPAPEPTELNKKEEDTGVAFKVTIATPWVRVMSTGTPEEAVRLVRAAHATILTFREVFGTESELNPGFTIYVLATDEERVKFVSGWPSWGPSQVEPTAAFVGAGVPMSQHTARWDGNEVNRLDGTIRHTIGELFRSEFDLNMRTAWAWEGLGIYLTRELVGTRRTWYGSSEGLDKEAKDLVARLVTVDDINWINEAYQLMLSGQATQLSELVKLKIDAIGVYDLLVTYALAAYLLEGHPEELTELLRVTRAPGSSTEVAFETVLGRSPGELDARFLRWLGERR